MESMVEEVDDVADDVDEDNEDDVWCFFCLALEF